MKTLRKLGLRLASWILPEKTQSSALRWISKRLRVQLFDQMTEDVLDALLEGMEMAFALCPGYRKNVAGFSGVYVFCAGKGKISDTVTFRDGHMERKEGAAPNADARIQFRDAKALWSFLLSENQDILDCILQDSVDVDGNLNYVYRFGFLAKDLMRRLDPLQLAQA